MRAHVFGEKTQVQHVAADAMHTEEWWEMPKWLKLHDGIHLSIHRLVLREQLSQSGDSQILQTARLQRGVDRTEI